MTGLEVLMLCLVSVAVYIRAPKLLKAIWKCAEPHEDVGDDIVAIFLFFVFTVGVAVSFMCRAMTDGDVLCFIVGFSWGIFGVVGAKWFYESCHSYGKDKPCSKTK